MKRTFPILLFVLFALIPACQVQKFTTVSHVRSTDVKPGSQGIFYVLPRTVITADFTITRVQEVPGPYAEFAMRHLGLQNVIRQPSTSYEISEITINSFSEPDPEQFYFVEFPEKGVAHHPLFLSFSESGLIRSINKPFENQEHLRGSDETREYGFYGTDATFNYFIDSNLQEKIDTILERVRVDTLTVERRTLRRSMVEKSPEVRAKEVADFILEVRDKRFEIINGYAEVPYSKEALEYMFTELSKMEDDYLQLFKGLKSISKIHYRYTFIPDPDRSSSPHTLFFFSEREGVLPPENGAGSPITISTERNGSTTQLKNFINRNQSVDAMATGFFYRIPEHANVIIRKSNTVRASARLLVNQFGVITNLPPQVEEVEFHPKTGSISTYGKIKE